VVCIQTDVEVEENKSRSVVVEILEIIIVAIAEVVVVVVVVVLVIVVVVVVVAVVALSTFIASEYKFGKSLLDLCTFVHTPSSAINDLLA